MERFPDPIPVPEEVWRRRRQRRQHLLKAACIGLVVRSVIVVGELIGYALFDSATLLVEALSTLGDFASTLFLMACIWLADRNPDSKHPLGHGRYEPLGGLQLGLVLALAGGLMAVQQGGDVLVDQAPPRLNGYVCLIPLGAVVLLEAAYRLVCRYARRQNSPALAVEAAHYRVDSLSSVLATLSLAMASWFPEVANVIDHTGALLIALFMVGIGLHAVYHNLQQLLDRKPPPEFFEMVERASLRVPGVMGTEKIQLQVYGPDAQVNIDIEVDPDLTVAQSHAITQKVRVEIQKEWPAVRDVLVHVEPFYPNDH